MNAQQLYDNIIKPTHAYMGKSYMGKDSGFLSLCTAAIESNCGEYIKQVGGPALSPWQIEPETEADIWINCDAMVNQPWFYTKIRNIMIDEFIDFSLMFSPMYACAMARLKYSMDPEPLPDHNNIRAVYDYYKRIYNTPAGASTFEKFERALKDNKILEVEL